jgi:hypothetical protein
MSSEPDPTLERAYRYRAGWKVVGCFVLLFGAIGASGTALLPVGCAKLRNGDMVLGVFIVAGCMLAVPMLLLAVAGLIVGLRDVIRPPLLRVTPTTLWLPASARGPATTDAQGKEVKPPPQPEEIPFAAIRWVRREAGPTPDAAKLMIVHDLSPTTLVIEQYMMRPDDFEELETVLRAAVPRAFAPAPPPTEP